MKKRFLFIFLIFSYFNSLADVTLNNNEIQISGVATTDEFQACPGVLWNSTSKIYELQYNVRLLSGADVRGINDLIIDFKGRRLFIDAGVVSAEFTDLTFMNSVGRGVALRFWVIDNGGGFVSFNNCQYIHNVQGGAVTGNGRHLDNINIEDLEETTIKSSEFTVQEVAVTFEKSSRVRNLVLKRASALSVTTTGICVFFINPKHHSRGTNGGYLAIYNGASAMVLNYVPDKTLNRDVGNYNGGVQDHWIYWLGTSVDNFQRQNNVNSLVIANRSNRLRNIGGGIRYYNFIGAAGATVNVFDSFANGKAPFLVDLTRADMLNTTLDYTLPTDENVEIVTRAFRYGGDTGWIYTPITGQKIAVLKYEKELKVIDVSSNPTAVIGSEESYAPILIVDDPFITETNKATVDAYTTIDNSAQFYDRAKAYLIDNYNGETEVLVTKEDSLINAGSYNVVIDASAAQAFAFDGTTITIKANTFTGEIETTGALTLSNGAEIYGGYIDITGTNKFIHLDWNENTTQNIILRNLSTNSTIVNSVPSTEFYKGHFLMPDPAPTAGIQVEIESPSGYNLFTETYPVDDLSFIRLDIELNVSEEKQIEMLFLAKKILQKSEGINEALTGTTPSIVDNTTVTNSNASATYENQDAILQLLKRVLNKVSANKEAYND